MKALLEFEGLELCMKEADGNLEYKLIRSKGLEGDLVNSVAMISLTATSIASVSRIIIEAIRCKRNPKLKISGKEFSFEIEGISEEKITKILEDELTNG